MGAFAMNKASGLDVFAREFGQARSCLSCEGIMLPTTTTIRRDYKGIVLTLINFPIVACNTCRHEQVNTSKILTYVKKARDNYDQNGLLEFDCDTLG
ncbi:MAG: hypothetical protein ACXVC1_08635 [Tumebacillaceae bacterium]